MEVAPQELAQLLKLAGVGAGPEPDMPEPEMAPEPEVSVMAIPSDDGAPVGGGCGAPEPEHDHSHEHGDMRSLIDMLKGGGEEPIEEAPPKDDYENASNEFTGHPVDVVDTYDQYSYEPAKNSGMQRRTNSYGDNPLREEDLIKEYTEFKKFPLFEVNWSNPDEVEAEYKRLGLDQGDDPLGGWWDTQGMSPLKIRKAREKRIKQAYKDNEVDKQQADFGRGSEGELAGAAAAYGINTKEPGWEDKLASAKQAEREQSDANVAAQKLKARQQAEYDEKHAGEEEAYAQLQDPSSKAAQQQHKQALDNLDQTVVAQSRSGENSPAVVGAKDRAAKQAARVASLDRQKLNDPNEIRNFPQTAAVASQPLDTEGPTRSPHTDTPVPMTNITPGLSKQMKAQNAPKLVPDTALSTGIQGGADALAKSGNYRNKPGVSGQGVVTTPTRNPHTDTPVQTGGGQSQRDGIKNQLKKMGKTMSSSSGNPQSDFAQTPKLGGGLGGSLKGSGNPHRNSAVKSDFAQTPKLGGGLGGTLKGPAGSTGIGNSTSIPSGGTKAGTSGPTPGGTNTDTRFKGFNLGKGPGKRGMQQKVTAGTYSDGTARLKILAGI